MRLPVLAATAALFTATAAAQDSDPAWLRKPTGDELRAVYPARAWAGGVDGRVTLVCTVTIRGGLENCQVVEETPKREGFGDAALLLAPSFTFRPAQKGGKPLPAKVSVPINFLMEGTAGDRDRAGVGARTRTVIANPLWLKAPASADLKAAWPAEAGAVDQAHVSYRCDFKPDGALDDCDLLTETPRGKGFAAAGRKLMPLFQIVVDPEDPQALTGVVANIQVRFTNPAIAPPSPGLVARPRWIRRLDLGQVQAIYPRIAIAAGVETGLGVAECTIATDGRLTACVVVREDPAGVGFGKAALSVASVMQLSPWSEDGAPLDGGKVRLPFRFNHAPAAAVAPTEP